MGATRASVAETARSTPSDGTDGTSASWVTKVLAVASPDGGTRTRAVTSNLLPIYDDLAYDVQSGEHINTPRGDATAMSGGEKAEAEARYEMMGDEGKAE